MDFWIIFSKLALLIFIAFTCVRTDISHISWVVFTILLYFCINITLNIFKEISLKRILLLLSIGISITSFFEINSLFILLLPLALIELTSDFFNKKIIILLISIVPIININETLQPLYGLVANFCFMIFTITSVYGDRLLKDEKQLDSMRKTLQKMTKNLNKNTEYIRQSEYTFKLEERNRISQEIHDKIGHSITGALFQMEAAKRLIETDKRKATELLQNAINISKDGIENIRLTLKNMKPPSEQVGIHRIKLIIDELAAKHQFKTVLTHDGNLDIITPIQWKIILENITEALTNTMKYSTATLVSVELKVLNKMIRVEVKDNGSGAEKIKKGLGIIGMEERTATVNGKVIVDGTRGFSVTTLLPIQP